MSDPLPRRRIGRTHLSVTALGFGTAPLGNLYRAVADEEALEALEAALEAGIGYFDTAPYYGFGLSESRLGEGLAGRADVVVSTKAGRLLAPADDIDVSAERHGFVSPMRFEPLFDYTRDGILRSHEESLRRLARERVDILLIHDIGRLTHGARDADYRRQLLDGGGLEALRRLRADGAVAAIGLGVNEVEVCIELMDHADFDVILLAGRYTLLEQGALDEFLPRCVDAGTSVVIGGPFNSGVLATGSSANGDARYNYEAAPDAVRQRVAKLDAACARHGVPLRAAALQFPLAHPAVSAVIPGFASAAEVAAGIAAFDLAIPDSLWPDLREQGLLHPEAPVPGAGREAAVA